MLASIACRNDFYLKYRFAEAKFFYSKNRILLEFEHCFETFLTNLYMMFVIIFCMLQIKAMIFTMLNVYNYDLNLYYYD